MLKLIGMSSNGSKAGLTRIQTLLSPAIQLDIVPVVAKLDDVDGYDGMIIHNWSGDPSGGRLHRLVYLASNASEGIARNKSARKSLKWATVWTNCDTAKNVLKDVFVTATTMYRPNGIKIFAHCPPVPKTRKVLWHWLKGGPSMKLRVEQEIAKAMMKVVERGFEIMVINSSNAKDLPVGVGAGITAAGKIDLSLTPDWLGMVRTYDQVDLGRSAFQVVAHGRWMLYWKTREPFVEAVDHIREVPAAVEALANEPDGHALKRWAYARDHFREKALKRLWQTEVGKVFNK